MFMKDTVLYRAAGPACKSNPCPAGNKVSSFIYLRIGRGQTGVTRERVALEVKRYPSRIDRRHSRNSTYAYGHADPFTRPPRKHPESLRAAHSDDLNV